MKLTSMCIETYIYIYIYIYMFASFLPDLFLHIHFEPKISIGFLR